MRRIKRFVAALLPLYVLCNALFPRRLINEQRNAIILVPFIYYSLIHCFIDINFFTIYSNR